MKKLPFYSLLLMLTFLYSEAQAQVKIGYMNPSVVLAQLEEVAVVDQLVEQLVQTRDQELMAKANELQADFVAYEEA